MGPAHMTGLLQPLTGSTVCIQADNCLTASSYAQLDTEQHEASSQRRVSKVSLQDGDAVCAEPQEGRFKWVVSVGVRGAVGGSQQRPCTHLSLTSVLDVPSCSVSCSSGCEAATSLQL